MATTAAFAVHCEAMRALTSKCQSLYAAPMLLLPSSSTPSPTPPIMLTPLYVHFPLCSHGIIQRELHTNFLVNIIKLYMQKNVKHSLNNNKSQRKAEIKK